ncbi:tryptophan-rich sensory protein [Methylobacterium oryzae CBMB20]
MIFALTATSGVLAWTGGIPTRSPAACCSPPSGRTGRSNIAWSVLFFRFRRPDWALAEVAALWLSIVALVLVTGRGLRRGGADEPALPRLGQHRRPA